MDSGVYFGLEAQLFPLLLTLLPIGRRGLLIWFSFLLLLATSLSCRMLSPVGDGAVCVDAMAMNVLNSSSVMSMLNISPFQCRVVVSRGRVISHIRCCLMLMLVSCLRFLTLLI